MALHPSPTPFPLEDVGSVPRTPEEAMPVWCACVQRLPPYFTAVVSMPTIAHSRTAEVLTFMFYESQQFCPNMAWPTPGPTRRPGDKALQLLLSRICKPLSSSPGPSPVLHMRASGTEGPSGWLLCPFPIPVPGQSRHLVTKGWIQGDSPGVLAQASGGLCLGRSSLPAQLRHQRPPERRGPCPHVPGPPDPLRAACAAGSQHQKAHHLSSLCQHLSLESLSHRRWWSLPLTSTELPLPWGSPLVTPWEGRGVQTLLGRER